MIENNIQFFQCLEKHIDRKRFRRLNFTREGLFMLGQNNFTIFVLIFKEIISLKHQSKTSLFPDQEKVVNFHQAENSVLYNVLQIARFVTKYERKYVYQMLVWQD